uniref:Uncharacterized protein n=1 Tax=Physcomitrium patens TaxID=3218 RepID=A0A2K1IX16_PHYPA|nr:hypothetical protein PHYPA_023627 [Physcomitrium patens]
MFARFNALSRLGHEGGYIEWPELFAFQHSTVWLPSTINSKMTLA